MKNVFNLFIGQKLHLLSVGKKNVDFDVKVREIGVQYTAIGLDELSDDDYLSLALDKPAGTLYTFSVCFEDGVYIFSCGFRGCELLPKKIIYLEHPDIDERIQRRNYIRIPYTGEISYAVISDLIEKIDNKQVVSPALFKGRKFAKAMAVNISAGGMLIRMPNALNSGENVGLILELPNVKSLLFVAEVMHCEEAKDDSGDYLIGVKFDEQIRRSPENMKFSRALADLQREWMKKGR